MPMAEKEENTLSQEKEKVNFEDIENDRETIKQKQEEIASLKDNLSEKIVKYIKQKEKEGWKRFYFESYEGEEGDFCEIYLFDPSVNFSQWNEKTFNDNKWEDYEERETSKFYDWLETLDNDKYSSFQENEIKNQYDDFILKPLNSPEES